ncbi:molybdate ABC transporter substrate-binding protein [Bacillus sp. RG28]|uniref:Molybdate ABC transporter substrate-binding protein n=1 Tax=Gottfriedia endophytica TaxID=2820819 RepID=A0A940SJS3_9BACI|nr:molybdate ABC transporter substrate-binding protein [Gottfriedia endophytica]MBP0725761.1 molybdate ABC transporter substrate-binding protein [Gottfriedia endophytica]
MLNKKLIWVLVSIIVVCAIVFGVVNKVTQTKFENKDNRKIELTISAAASLKDSLIEIQSVYEKSHPNVKLRFNFGASGTLQQQIENGAPVDLFFSAGKDKFNKLIKEGLTSKKESVDLIGNELVLIEPKNSNFQVKNFEDLKLNEVKKISIGTPDLVPAGQYAKESLENMNLWSSINQKIVYAKDVRQVLSYVETGNVDAGVVYKTDALTSKKVKIVETANNQTHKPIIYPVGIISDTKNHNETKEFYSFLQSKKSMEIFEKHGFLSK